MFDDLRVSTGPVREAGAALTGAGSGIESIGGNLTSLSGSGSHLTGDGGAGAAFDGMVSTWTRELEGLGGYVTALGSGAGTAAENYEVNEYGVSEMFGGTA